MRHEHKGKRIEEVRTVQNRPTIIEINNNLPLDFLLGHRGKPLPEPYHGSGVAMRPASRVPYRNVYHQARSAIFRKAAVCGEAARFPRPKRGK